MPLKLLLPLPLSLLLVMLLLFVVDDVDVVILRLCLCVCVCMTGREPSCTKWYLPLATFLSGGTSPRYISERGARWGVAPPEKMGGPEGKAPRKIFYP